VLHCVALCCTVLAAIEHQQARKIEREKEKKERDDKREKKHVKAREK